MDAHEPETSEPVLGDQKVPHLDPQEINDLLKEQVLEVYSTPREKLFTRDGAAAIQRNEYIARKSKKPFLLNPTDETTLLQLKAKQEALIRLYQNVISDKTQSEKQYQPWTTSKGPFSSKDASGVFSEKVVTVKGPPPPPPSQEESDNMSDVSSKERSKFVLKHQQQRAPPPLKLKPPPLLEGILQRTSSSLRDRKDVRYSEGKDRYSFEVDVVGPLLRYIDPRYPPPTTRTIAIQAVMVDDERHLSKDYGDVGSQMDFGSSRRGSIKRDSGMSGRSSFDRAGDESNFEFEGQPGEDASSSNSFEMLEKIEDGDNDDELVNSDESLKGQRLERKESRRRDAETMSRPVGYKKLDLRESQDPLTCDVEAHVTPFDLEREQAKLRSITLPRDNVVWPTSAEFDIDKTGKKIEDYISSCWEIDPRWMFVVQPLEVYHDSYRKKYVFEVKFSIPSSTTPVPPATASVYFVFESKVYAMMNNTMDVKYVLEGSRFAHTPGNIPFQDKWLWEIIWDKLRVQKGVNLKL